MPTLYLVISPSGAVARATTDPAEAEFYRPQEYPDGTPMFAGYELYAIDALTPWVEVRAEKRRLLENPRDVKLDGFDAP